MPILKALEKGSIPIEKRKSYMVDIHVTNDLRDAVSGEVIWSLHDVRVLARRRAIESAKR